MTLMDFEELYDRYLILLILNTDSLIFFSEHTSDLFYS